jgi:ABC-2 type transport system permease protein
MDKIFLRFVTFLTPVLEKTGVDTDQLYYIIQVKLMMDNRRPRAGFTAGKNSQSSTKVKSPWAINVFTVVLGFFIGMVHQQRTLHSPNVVFHRIYGNAGAYAYF